MKFEYGPIEHLITDTSISEIMINAFDKIFVEHRGVLVVTEIRFQDEQSLWDLVVNILAADGKARTDSLYYEGALPNGSRYNITLPPMTPRGPCITIRKHHNRRIELRELVNEGSLTSEAARFLTMVVKDRKNLIVSGGSGTGKTSLLQALASMISPDERILTIEDVPEIHLSHQNWVSLLSVNESLTKVTIRDCLFNALRMRPDRIIVGECRRDEAFDMLQAMNTGHEGSMTTLHANSPSECLMRLENLLYMAKLDLPVRALRMQISRAVQFVVQLKRLPTGQRVVSEIIELTGMEGDTITRASVFLRNDKGVFEYTGYTPKSIQFRPV